MNCRPKSLLVVEDDAALRAVIKFNLELGGYKVTAARNGQEAWTVLESASEAFDLLVTDHQMPLMTGEQLCRKLRGEERFMRLPVVMLTAKELEVDSRYLCEELSLVGIVSKPFSPQSLRDLVFQTLESSALIVDRKASSP